MKRTLIGVVRGVATLFAAALPILCAAQGGADEPVDLFVEGQDGYAGYRIPAIVRAADGALLAFAEARRNDKRDAGDIDLVMRRSTDGGRTWGPTTVVWDDGANTCGNPAPVVVGRRGEIVLLATWNAGGDRERAIERDAASDTRRVFVLRSADHGRSWSAPREITEEVKLPGWTWYATGPCHAIVKRRAPHKGRLVVPANHKRLGDGGVVESYSQLLYSDDRGATWHLGAVSQCGGNESTVAETSDGGLLLNMRHYAREDSLRLYALSADGGASWSCRGEVPALPEPRCQGSLLNLTRRGRPTQTLLFCNPHHPRKRINLTLSVSRDDGRSWVPWRTLFAGCAAYCDLVRLDERRVGVLYENGDEEDLYRRISFVTVDVSPLLGPENR